MKTLSSFEKIAQKKQTQKPIKNRHPQYRPNPSSNSCDHLWAGAKGQQQW